MTMTATGAELSQQLETERQQRLDDFRKNAALDALVKAHGDMAGDPEVWLKGTQAQAAQDVEPTVGPTAQADLQTKQLSNQESERDQQGRALYSVAQMAKSAAGPDGSIAPAAYDKLFSNPLVQKATGITPDQVAQARSLITGPGGAQHLDSIARAALGPTKMQGAVGYGTDSSGNPVQIGRDQYGNPVMQSLGGVTPTAVQNSNTKVNNSIVGPDGKPNAAYIDAKKQIAQNAAKAGVTLTPEALSMFASEAAITGKIQSFGMGGKNNVAAIGNTLAAGGTTGEQLAENQQTYKTKQVAMSDLAKSSPMSAGGLVRSAGAVIQHIDTLDQYIGALQNKNLKLANALSQRFKIETGNPAPTNFNLQKQIVAAELLKFLQGGRSTLGDRKEIQASIDKANSPAQLHNAINTLKADLGAQLGSQYAQFEGVGAGPEYLRTLTPSARTMITGVAESGPRAAASGKPNGHISDTDLLARYGVH